MKPKKPEMPAWRPTHYVCSACCQREFIESVESHAKYCNPKQWEGREAERLARGIALTGGSYSTRDARHEENAASQRRDIA